MFAPLALKMIAASPLPAARNALFNAAVVASETLRPWPSLHDTCCTA